MFLKNSLKNLVRSGGKTTLFFLLILIITIVQCLGLSIWLSIDNFLDDCNENYLTIGIFEYMGPEYPDDNIYDPGSRNALNEFDFSQIGDNDSVLVWDTSDRALGYIEGLDRRDVYAPLRDNAVVIISNIGNFNRYGLNSAQIIETLYSGYDFDGKAVLIEDFGYDLEEGHTYLVHGTLGYGRTSYKYLYPSPYKNTSAVQAGYDKFDEYMILDITDGMNGIEEQYSAFETIARTYNVINNSIKIYATNNINSILAFHQQKLYIKEGRDFTEEEYKDGAEVCVITEFIAEQLGLEVGDEITLSVAIADDTPVYESYWDGTGFASEEKYKITGISNTLSDRVSDVYIPKNKGIDYSKNQIGYTIGRAVIDNDRADEFYNDISSYLPDRVRLTIYDQGYSTVVEPFKKILRIAIIISCTSILAGLAVIILFGFLFVYRQRDTSDIMIKLGSGKFKTGRYFLYGSGLVALFGAGIGSAAGYYLSKLVVKILKSSLEKYSLINRNFSISNLSIIKNTEWVTDVDMRVFILVGAFVLIMALVSCLIFTLITFRNKNKKRKKIKKIKRQGRSLSFMGGPLKYTLISIIRNGQRSIITPLVTIAVILLISQLTSTALRYETQLEDISRNSVINGQFMDINGRYYNNLVVEGYQLNELYSSNLIDNITVTKSRPFHYLGISEKNGEVQVVEPFELPGGFAGETMLDKIRRGHKVIFTNNITNTPEFYYSNSLRIEFMKGYDESFLGVEGQGIEFIDRKDKLFPKADGWKTSCCLVSSEFLAENDINYGDTIRIVLVDRYIIELDYKVVGSYIKEGEKDNIYCQLSEYINPAFLTTLPEGGREQLFKYTFESANFTVKDPCKLNEFKDFMLDYGFSQVNKIRTYRAFPVLDDKTFIGTVESLNQRIRQTEILYPFLYSLIGVLAFILSFILILSRKNEIAVMRGLGTEKHSIFTTFFIEQLFLCILGTGIGLAAWGLYAASYNSLQIVLTAGFIMLYCLGSAAALIIINRSGVLAILGEEE